MKTIYKNTEEHQKIINNNRHLLNNSPLFLDDGYIVGYDDETGSTTDKTNWTEDDIILYRYYKYQHDLGTIENLIKSKIQLEISSNELQSNINILKATALLLREAVKFNVYINNKPQWQQLENTMIQFGAHWENTYLNRVGLKFKWFSEYKKKIKYIMIGVITTVIATPPVLALMII